MSEFRQDIVNQDWVLIAEKRARRPGGLKFESATVKDKPGHEKRCVFCPGKESKTPQEIYRYPKNKNWQVRVVPNKFEALNHKPARVKKDDFYSNREALGDQEVIITRYHDQPTALQPISLIDLTLKTYIERIEKLKIHPEIQYVHVIQNHGSQAGASLHHPHSQIYAIPFLPDRLRAEVFGTLNYFERHGQCLYCQIIKKELRDKKRIIFNTRDFVVMAPYASREPFQIRVLPKRHRMAFEDISSSERQKLAQIMKRVFKRIYDKLKNPPYNYYIHTLPSGKSWGDESWYHWHMIVLPRVRVWAGIELGTEVYINAVSPETAAKFLR